MEGDKENFKAILKPHIVDLISEGLKKQQLEAISTVDDLEVKEYPDTLVTPLNQYCK